MGPSLNSDEKKKNWRDKKNDRRNMKASATKTHTKSEEVDNSKTVFSDLIFVVTASPDKVQSHYASATSAIPEDPTIKDIFAAAGALMQVMEAETTRNTYTVNPEIPNCQVSMLFKKGATLVDQGGNSYSMNALILSGCTSLGNGNPKPIVNGETNKPYLIQSYLEISFAKE